MGELRAFRRRVALVASLLVLAAATSAVAQGQADLVAVGREIYLHGRLGDGGLLEGQREASRPVLSGQDAACVNCHRHSGLGMTEGRNQIPPITGRFLNPPHSLAEDKPDLPFVETMRPGRRAYSDATTARVIRTGINADDRALSTLMPRFQLGDADMAALIAYLKAMDRPVQPGVGQTELHFATIVTPDADPVRREAFLTELRQYFKDKNDKAFTIGPAAPIHPSIRSMESKMLLLVPRRWQLHVWELQGAPDTWAAQLDADLAREPVLAVLSGIGGPEWGPVHRFCEARAVPCLFPNVDLPLDGADDFYTLYFSAGLGLEADLIAARIAQQAAAVPVRVFQVYRQGTVGAGAASRLSAALQRHGIADTLDGVPTGSGAAGLEAAVARAAQAQVLVLWLDAADVATLGVLPEAIHQVYLSGRMAGYERMPLPAAWRDKSLVAYPVDLPERRQVRMRYVEDWLRSRQVPVSDLPLQADTWLACSVVNETLTEMIDAIIPEYLVEQVQEDLKHRFITGYYPRLSLADHQRFASKGGYLVRFAEAQGPKVVPVGGWMVPDGP